jgi:glycosyltransferase involved in cell wall biosynthesis
MIHPIKIAVYTIAKNEEQFVKRWYESAKQADGLFILDTGSTDATVAVAESLGVTVEVLVVNSWRFDVARNASLAMIPDNYDMCIALDMDEILVDGWREHVEQAFAAGVNRPRYEYTWSWDGDNPGLVYGGDKIHSRHGFVWKHPVHEVLVCEGVEVQVWCGLKIHHHPDSSKSRGQYFSLLELAVEEDPEDDRNSHYLAREYFFHNKLEDAELEFKRHLSLPRSVWGPERAQSCRYLYKITNDVSWLNQAIAEAPGRREALVDLAFHYYGDGEWNKCLCAVTEALKIKDRPLEYLSEAFAWGVLPEDLAAISAYHMGYFHQAMHHGLNAMLLSPMDKRIVDNYKVYVEAAK